MSSLLLLSAWIIPDGRKRSAKSGKEKKTTSRRGGGEGEEESSATGSWEEKAAEPIIAQQAPPEGKAGGWRGEEGVAAAAAEASSTPDQADQPHSILRQVAGRTNPFLTCCWGLSKIHKKRVINSWVRFSSDFLQYSTIGKEVPRVEWEGKRGRHFVYCVKSVGFLCLSQYCKLNCIHNIKSNISYWPLTACMHGHYTNRKVLADFAVCTVCNVKFSKIEGNSRIVRHIIYVL